MEETVAMMRADVPNQGIWTSHPKLGGTIMKELHVAVLFYSNTFRKSVCGDGNSTVLEDCNKFMCTSKTTEFLQWQ
jgi:hypothetical protein